MISDFSGAAYEYALGTARPVLLVDVRRKTMNPETSMSCWRNRDAHAPRRRSAGSIQADPGAAADWRRGESGP